MSFVLSLFALGMAILAWVILRAVAENVNRLTLKIESLEKAQQEMMTPVLTNTKHAPWRVDLTRALHSGEKFIVVDAYDEPSAIREALKIGVAPRHIRHAIPMK